MLSFCTNGKLGEASVHASQPDRILCSLYPHQQTAVAAILNVEEKRKIQNVTTDAVCIAEPYGSGKTIIALSVIAERQVPPAFPLIRSGTSMLNIKKAPVVRKKFLGESLISSNLIIVGSPVLVQWEMAIRDQTKMKVFAISDYNSDKVVVRISVDIPVPVNDRQLR